MVKMLNDFEMIVHRFPDREDITIFPIADVHVGAKEHLTGEWNKFCKYIQGVPNGYIMLVGDLLNNATKSSVSNVYDEVLRPNEQKELMIKYLTPLKDRILCALPGNHERRTSKEVDQDITYEIVSRLGVENLYRENIAFIKLQFGNNQKGNGGGNPTYILAATHGSGGGVLPGGVINRNERFGYAIDGIDALIVAHSHKIMASMPAKMKVDPTHNRINLVPFRVIVASSWLGYSGYPVQKQLLPGGNAANRLVLCGHEKKMEAII